MVNFSQFFDIPNILNSMINNITEYTCNENRKNFGSKIIHARYRKKN